MLYYFCPKIGWLFLYVSFASYRHIVFIITVGEMTRKLLLGKIIQIKLYLQRHKKNLLVALSENRLRGVMRSCSSWHWIHKMSPLFSDHWRMSCSRQRSIWNRYLLGSIYIYWSCICIYSVTLYLLIGTFILLYFFNFFVSHWSIVD